MRQCKSKDKLIKRRLDLANSIAHFRLMIRRGYHPEFFEKLLRIEQTKQSEVLYQERNL